MSSAVISGPPPIAMGVMKGPSSHQMGEETTFTITCYTCGMPSSKEWAQRVHTRPRSIPGRPFYPFLAELKSPPVGAHLSVQDGSTFLCAFCQASLEAQWLAFEKRNILIKDRQYSLNSFICSVCSIETYRKRVRALPFQEFPFLTKERPRGSLTLGKSPLAVVCLDCSETLWAQSSEYDRWGLPIQKRHFNWMSRPPPPENSMEATVARLPSGETQLPRCPPTEPLVVPRRKEPFPGVAIRNSIPEFGIQISSSISPNHNPHQIPSRRPLVTELMGKGASPERSIVSSKSPGSGKSPSRSIPDPHTLLLQGGGVPIVTVAPMTSFATTTSTNSYRESTKLVGGFPSLPNLESFRHSKSETHPTNVFPMSLATSNINYAPFNHWGGTNQLDHFPYPPPPPPGFESMISSSIHQGDSQFPWIPTSTITNPDYLRYQAYLSAIAGNNYKNAVESFFSQPHPHPLLQTSVTSACSDVPTHALSRTVNTNRSRTCISSSPSPHQVSQGSGGKYYASSSSILNSQPVDASSRKRFGMSTCPPSLPKIPHLQNSSSSKPASDFVTIPRLSRHLDPGKGVERNRNYIQSVSAIVNELELSRPRQTGRNGIDPFSELSPQKRKQALEDVNGAMDLSLMRALKATRADASSGPGPRNSTNNYQAIPQDGKPNSGFLIANLCSENMSPHPLEEGKKLTSIQQSHEGELEGRNSVIVKVKSPSRFVVTNSPVLVSPTAIEEPINVDAYSISKEQRPKMASPLRSKTVSPLHSNTGKKSEPSRCPSPRIRINDVSPSLPVFPELPHCASVGDDRETKFVPVEPSNTATGNIGYVNSPNDVSLTPIPIKIEKDDDKILEESILAFKKEKAKRTAMMQDVNVAKERFLRFLELVPPKEKNEIDLKILLSRYKRKTLPPIKLRVAEKEEESMSEEVEKHVLLTAFDDPSLRKSVSNPKLISFMTNLDMKATSKAEKYQREEIWRLKLAERIARLKRGRKLSGEKKPWDMTDGNISKHLLPNVCGGRTRRHSIPPVSERKLLGHYRSLSVSLPPDPQRYGNQSSDLLTTVVANDKESKELAASEYQESPVPMPNRLGMNSENLEKILKLAHRGRTPVITYPKYVPSYATTAPEKGSPPAPNSPVTNSKIPPPSVSPNKDLVPPIVTRVPTPLTTCTQNENGVVPVSSPASTIDGIIQRSSNCWKETKDEIERLLKMKCEVKTEKRIPAAELKRLRRSINTQQLEMKGMVKWLKELSSGPE